MHEDASLHLLAEDESARAQALDVRRSFLVQAPAGSGKTELLIQRYLALLSRVEEPEHIVALTFTRKAAGEMRERVSAALLDAKEAREPGEPHAQVTYALARKAIEQDTRRGWAITEHASRLSMSTFDALATELARRAPLAAGLGPHPEYIDDGTPLYRAAAEAVIARARAEDPHWRTLLVHLDNDAPRVAKLIADLLQRRDQWLRQVTATPLADLRIGLEQALRDEIADVLNATRAAFPEGVGAEICARASDAAAFLSGRDDAVELAAAVDVCSRGLPEATVEALPHWRALARFLMVKGCKSFKKSLQEKDGFPAVGQGPGARGRRARKLAMASLCATLNAKPGLAEALAAASELPEPRLGDEPWRTVEALLEILRAAAAELATVFATQRRFDFVQGNLAALQALGEEDAPSDLLLRLDAQVQHLLVDEFQDTSFVQLGLLRKLTAGWQPDDGRTLFAVGDPMQSIYRFREAEVRFFLDAQREGTIGSVPVEMLRLRRNFRSQANLVAWSNERFAPVLGSVNDPIRGVVAFEPAVAAREAMEGVHPTVDLCATPREEAAKVVDRIRAAQDAGDGSIAVLVRARNHLVELLPALRGAPIPFAAVELDRLSDRQAVIDLLALTHALIQPADRTAWLAVLRAPWCGLTLADLFAVVAAAGEERLAPLLPALGDIDSIEGLSREGRVRLRRTLDVLLPALAARGRLRVADRVRNAWLALGGPACLDDRLDLEAASIYFDLVDKHDVGGDLPDRAALASALDLLRATPHVDAAGVQVMTMHKAKGLQFDTVILPGLAADPKPGDGPLLRWRRRDAGLLIAPGSGRGGEPEPLYSYLTRLDREAEDAELGRLLYVACTRARQRLHLVAVAAIRTDAQSATSSWKEPVKSSSLGKLWPVLAPRLEPPVQGAPAFTPAPAEPPALIRLPLDYRAFIDDDGLRAAVPLSERDLVTPPFDWARETTRRIGTLAHRLLARIADEGLHAWSPERIESLRPRVHADLLSAGFTPDELPAAGARVLEAVRRTLADPRGRWLFDSAHEDARSEWALSGVDRGEIVRVVVDRTFVANGERWIVDFKTGTHEGGDANAFLASEVERYRDPMTRYARMMRGMDARPVRLALYYPLIEGGFREIPVGHETLPK